MIDRVAWQLSLSSFSALIGGDGIPKLDSVQSEFWTALVESASLQIYFDFCDPSPFVNTSFSETVFATTQLSDM
jgi:hypothetical protein